MVRMAEVLGGAGEGTQLGLPGLPLYVVVHALVATAWMVLFLVQALLIKSDHHDIHQNLGVAGLFLAAAVVISGVAVSFLAIPRLIALTNPADPSIIIAENLPFFAGNVGAFMAFSLAVGGAAYFRRKPQTHKHLMLLASVIVVTPAIDRMWGWSGLENALEFWFPMTVNALVVAVIGGDWLIRRRPPWALLAGFAVWSVPEGAMFGFGSTDIAQSWALALVT